MKHLLAALLALTLGACATPPAGCLRLAPDGWYCPAFAAWATFETEQATTVRFRGQSIQLLTRIRSDGDSVQLVSISPLGQTLISASWRQGQLSADLPPGLNGRIDPALLPGLLELALAPADMVRPRLGGNLSLDEGEGHRKLLSGRGKEIEINWRGSALPYESLKIDIPPLGLVIDSQVIEEDQQ
jgi:hypothetical protein